MSSYFTMFFSQSIFQQGLHHLVQTEQVYTNISHQLDFAHRGWARCWGLAAAVYGCSIISEDTIWQDPRCLGHNDQVVVTRLFICIVSFVWSPSDLCKNSFDISSKHTTVTSCCHILSVMGNIAAHLNEETKTRIVCKWRLFNVVVTLSGSGVHYICPCRRFDVTAEDFQFIPGGYLCCCGDSLSIGVQWRHQTNSGWNSLSSFAVFLLRFGEGIAVFLSLTYSSCLILP